MIFVFYCYFGAYSSSFWCNKNQNFHRLRGVGYRKGSKKTRATRIKSISFNKLSVSCLFMILFRFSFDQANEAEAVDKLTFANTFESY